MELNERIFYILEQSSKTAKNLSEYIGIKPSSVSAWKTEGSYPSSKYILKIAEFLEVDVYYLLTGEGRDTSNDLMDSETELLDTYRQLDGRGKHTLHAVSYEELDRTNGIPPKKNRMQEIG